jgi:hypothetical protein
MDIRTALVAHLQPSEAVQPRVRALDNPAIPAELLLRLNALAGDARRDPPLAQRSLVLLRLVPFVRVQLHRALAGAPSWPLDRLDGIHGFFQHRSVVDVRSRQQDRERDTLFVDNKMPLRSLFAAIRWILPGFFAPPGAGTVEESIAALVQSMRSASPSRSKKTLWSRSQTPACCQSRRRRQQVIPEPQPICGGSISQGMPVMSTKRMPVNTARSGIGGRPPLGRGFCGGSNGSMAVHSWSETIGLAIKPSIATVRGFVRRSKCGARNGALRRP